MYNMQVVDLGEFLRKFFLHSRVFSHPARRDWEKVELAAGNMVDDVDRLWAD